MKQVIDWNFERRQLNTFGKCEVGYNGYRLYYEKLAEEREKNVGEVSDILLLNLDTCT